MTEIAIDRSDATTLNWMPLPYPGITAVLTRTKKCFTSHEEVPWRSNFQDRINELIVSAESKPWSCADVNNKDLSDAYDFLTRVLKAPGTSLPWIGLLDNGGLELVWRFERLELEAIFDSVEDEAMITIISNGQEHTVPIDQVQTLSELAPEEFLVGAGEGPATNAAN